MDFLTDAISAGTGAGTGAGVGAGIAWALLRGELRSAKEAVANLRALLVSESRARRDDIRDIRKDLQSLMLLMAKRKEQ